MTVRQLWQFQEKVLGNPAGRDAPVFVQRDGQIAPLAWVRLAQIDGKWAVVLCDEEKVEKEG